MSYFKLHTSSLLEQKLQMFLKYHVIIMRLYRCPPSISQLEKREIVK